MQRYPYRIAAPVSPEFYRALTGLSESRHVGVALVVRELLEAQLLEGKKQSGRQDTTPDGRREATTATKPEVSS